MEKKIGTEQSDRFSSDTSAADPVGQKKKPYRPPVLTEYGMVRDFTQTMSMNTGTDGGTAPMNRGAMTTCLGTLSSLDEHRILLDDRLMQEAFRRAIMETVRPGDVVLDLGCGSGVHSLFACQAGAKKVYAVDSEPIIELAKLIACDNGYDDRISFYFGSSSEVKLPEKVDVIISNIGFLGLLRYLPEAAGRFLKKGGRLIPNGTELSFVPVGAEAVYRTNVESWDRERYGLDFSALKEVASAQVWADHFTKADYLASPVGLPKIDYADVKGPSFEWQLNFKFKRSGIMRGVAGWYSFSLSKKERLSTEPPLRLSPRVWYHPFLPLQAPLAVKKGEELNLKLEFYPAVNPFDPVWRWSYRHGGVDYQQSSFDAIPLSPEILAKLVPRQESFFT